MASTPATTALSWPPDRKIWASGLGAVAMALLVSAAKHYLNWDIPPDVQTSIVVLTTSLIAYLVPPSMRDVIKRVDDTVIEIARASDESTASEKAPPMTPAMANKVNAAVNK